MKDKQLVQDISRLIDDMEYSEEEYSNNWRLTESAIIEQYKDELQMILDRNLKKEAKEQAGLIIVTRSHDLKDFSNNMNSRECIIEIHFCTAYTQVVVQEFDGELKLVTKDIICPALMDGEVNPLDYIAVQDTDLGFLTLS